MVKQIFNEEEIYKDLDIGNKFLLNEEYDEKDVINYYYVIDNHDDIVYDIQYHSATFIRDQYLCPKQIQVVSDDDTYSIFKFKNNFIKCTYNSISKRYMPVYMIDFLSKYEFNGFDVVNNDKHIGESNSILFNKILIIPLDIYGIYLLISINDIVNNYTWKSSECIYVIHTNYDDHHYNEYELYELEDYNIQDILTIFENSFKDNEYFNEIKDYYIAHTLNPIDVQFDINKIQLIKKAYSYDEEVIHKFFDPIYIDDNALNLSFILDKQYYYDFQVVTIGEQNEDVINEVKRKTKALLQYNKNKSLIDIYTGDLQDPCFLIIYRDCECVVIKNNYRTVFYTLLNGYYVEAIDEEIIDIKQKMETIRVLQKAK